MLVPTITQFYITIVVYEAVGLSSLGLRITVFISCWRSVRLTTREHQAIDYSNMLKSSRS